MEVTIKEILKVGIDMIVHDFETKKIDAKVMGTRQAKIQDKIFDMCKTETNLRLAVI